MDSARRPRPPVTVHRWLAAFAVLTLASTIPRPASARHLTLTLAPDPATWADVVTLRVAGEITTSCGASILHLANVRKPSAIGVQLLVEVDLVEDPCPLLAPPVTVPFALAIELGHLPPGSTVLRVHDLADGTLTQRDFLVYDVSRLGLDVPAAATSSQPVKVALTYYDDCSSVQPQVAGNVITLTYSSGCNVLPPPPHLVRRDVDVGTLPPGDYEVRLVEPFASVAPALRRLPLHVWAADGCVPSAESLCLDDGRFRLHASWRAFDGSTGLAHAVPLAANDGSGLFWFFGPDNTELTVKVLDGCGLDGSWWVFVASSSTVEYRLTVTDTRTGASRSYDNALGHLPELIADTGAFDCP